MAETETKTILEAGDIVNLLGTVVRFIKVERHDPDQPWLLTVQRVEGLGYQPGWSPFV